MAGLEGLSPFDIGARLASGITADSLPEPDAASPAVVDGIRRNIAGMSDSAVRGYLRNCEETGQKADFTSAAKVAIRHLLEVSFDESAEANTMDGLKRNRGSVIRSQIAGLSVRDPEFGAALAHVAAGLADEYGKIYDRNFGPGAGAGFNPSAKVWMEYLANMYASVADGNGQAIAKYAPGDHGPVRSHSVTVPYRNPSLVLPDATVTKRLTPMEKLRELTRPRSGGKRPSQKPGG